MLAEIHPHVQVVAAPGNSSLVIAGSPHLEVRSVRREVGLACGLPNFYISVVVVRADSRGFIPGAFAFGKQEHLLIDFIQFLKER